jgi:protein ImuA
MTVVKKTEILEKLQTDILRLQGLRRKESGLDLGLSQLKDAFPEGSLPIAAIHEFVTTSIEEVASTRGFVSCLLGSLIGDKGTAVWINQLETVFPPGLINFGIQPHRIIFISVTKAKDILWVFEEALKCEALSAVIGEISELGFTESRRLQLAVEKSSVTGFVIRNSNRKLPTTACVSRWKISSLPSESIEDLPGIGFPVWRVELLRIRNGRPGVWHLCWRNGKFVSSQSDSVGSMEKAGASDSRLHISRDSQQSYPSVKVV